MMMKCVSGFIQAVNCIVILSFTLYVEDEASSSFKASVRKQKPKNTFRLVIQTIIFAVKKWKNKYFKLRTT